MPDGADNLVSILHISDIHRMTNAHSSNTVLFGDLYTDITRSYKEENRVLAEAVPKLRKPDLIVLSGDLTQRGTKSEFDLAMTFLSRMATLVDGDRRRIILVPGNHDLNWHISSYAYKKAKKRDIQAFDATLPRHLQRVKRAEDGSYWVKKDELYINRFRPFQRFFDAFYEGLYAYSLDRDRMFTVYDFSREFGIVLTGFNSCDEVDGYRDRERTLRRLDGRAYIHEDVFTNSLVSPAFHADRDELVRIGVFHHNIRSYKYGTDFLDPVQLSRLERQGYDLCLHGHVHKASDDLFYQARRDTSMPVVGTGSLAAPYADRPPAAPMGYNLVLVDARTKGIWVHSRRRDEDDTCWAPDYRWNGKSWFVAREPARTRPEGWAA